MKPAGFLLMLSGWGLVFAALSLLSNLTALTAFVLAGLGVEALGFIFVARAHLPAKPNRHAR